MIWLAISVVVAALLLGGSFVLSTYIKQSHELQDRKDDRRMALQTAEVESVRLHIEARSSAVAAAVKAVDSVTGYRASDRVTDDQIERALADISRAIGEI